MTRSPIVNFTGLPASPFFRNALYKGQIQGKFFKNKGQIQGKIKGKFYFFLRLLLKSTLNSVTLSTIELSYLSFRILSKSNYLEGSICLSKLNFNTLVLVAVWTRKLIWEGSAGFPRCPII